MGDFHTDCILNENSLLRRCFRQRIMGFDKNKGVTLYNFTKHENAEAKSCCNFRIESDNEKDYTLNIESKGAW